MIVSRSIFTQIIHLFGHLSERRRRHYYLLFALTLVSAFMEVVSLSAVIPFISVISSPDGLSKYPFINDILSSVGILEGSNSVFIISVGFMVVAIIAGLVRILLIWVGINIVNASARDLSDKVFSLILYQPYTCLLYTSPSPRDS